MTNPTPVPKCEECPNPATTERMVSYVACTPYDQPDISTLERVPLCDGCAHEEDTYVRENVIPPRLTMNAWELYEIHGWSRMMGILISAGWSQDAAESLTTGQAIEAVACVQDQMTYDYPIN